MTVVFIAGATGYVGREVVRLLAEQAKLEKAAAAAPRVIAHVRPDSAQLAEWRERFGALGAEVDTTAWSREAMAATIARVRATHLLCLIGTTRKRAAKEGIDDRYRAIDLGLTQLLVEASQDAVKAGAPAPRFVYLSSIGASAKASSGYLRARGEAEAVVSASGLPYLIARPSIVTGSDRDESRPGERTAAVVMNGAMAVLGVFGAKRLRDRWRSTDGASLAAALIRLGVEGQGDRIVESDELQRSGRTA